GSSGALAEQINQGAPVDVFVAAAAAPVDDLVRSGKLLADTRRDVAANDLVLVVPATRSGAAASGEIRAFSDLAAPTVKRIAIGEPKTVPAGRYAAEVFKTLKIDGAAFAAKLVFGGNVRQVLTYVETANVAAGVVYATDAQSNAKVRVVAKADP